MRNADRSFVSIQRALFKNYKKSRNLPMSEQVFRRFNQEDFEFSLRGGILPVYYSEELFYLEDSSGFIRFSNSDEEFNEADPLFITVESETENENFKELEDKDILTIIADLKSCVQLENFHLLPDLIMELLKKLQEEADPSAKTLIISIEALEEVYWDLFKKGGDGLREEYGQILHYSIFFVLLMENHSDWSRTFVKEMVDWGKRCIDEFGVNAEFLTFMIKILRYQSGLFRLDNLRNIALDSLKSAILYCRELISLENQRILGDCVGEIRLAILYWDCAHIFAEIGDKNQAYLFYNEVLNLWKALDSGTRDDAEKIFDVQTILAQIDQREGKKIDALKRIEDALEYAQRAYEKKTLPNIQKFVAAYEFKIVLMENACTLDEIGVLLDRVHDLFFEYYEQESESLNAEVCKCIFINRYYTIRAIVSTMKNDLEEAERCYFKAIQAFVDLPFCKLADFIMIIYFRGLCNLLYLLVAENKEDEAIYILKLALKFLYKRIKDSEAKESFFSMCTMLKNSFPDLQLKLEEENNSSHFLSQELDHLKDRIDEGDFQQQTLYADLLKIRGADYARYGLTADEAVNDLLTARNYMEFSILDECSYNLVNNYFETTLQISDLYQKQGKPEEAVNVLQTSKTMISSLMERKRFEFLPEMISIIVHLMTLLKKISSSSDALRLCDEFLAELAENQKIYSPGESLLNGLNEDGFFVSLRRVSAFDLQMQTPLFPPNWENIQHDLGKRTACPPEDLLKAKQYICEFFQQNITVLEIARFHIKQIKSRIRPVAAWMEKIIPEYITRTLLKFKQYDKVLPHFLYDYRKIKSVVGSPSKISNNYVRWFNQLAKFVEAGESTIYRSDLLVLLEACLKQCSIINIISTQEMEKMFNIILAHTLLGYRLNKIQAGFDFVRLSNIKAAWGLFHLNTKTHFKTIKATLEILYELQSKGYENANDLLANNFLKLGSDISIMDYNKASKYYRKACRYYLRLYKKNPSYENVYGLGKTYCTWGKNLEDSGRYRKAGQYYRKGISFLIRVERFWNINQCMMKLFYFSRLAQLILDHGKNNTIKKVYPILKFAYQEIEKSNYEMFTENYRTYYIAWHLMTDFLLENYLLKPLKLVWKQMARFFDACPDVKFQCGIWYIEYFEIKFAEANYWTLFNELDKALEIIDELRNDLEKSNLCMDNHRKTDFIFRLNNLQISIYVLDHEYEKGIQFYRENMSVFERNLVDLDQNLKFLKGIEDSWGLFSKSVVSCFIAKKRYATAKKICIPFLDSCEENFQSGKLSIAFVEIVAAYMEILCLKGEYESGLQWAEKCLKTYRPDDFCFYDRIQLAYNGVFRWRAFAYWKKNEVGKALADLDYLIRNKSKMIPRVGEIAIADLAELYYLKGEVFMDVGRIPEAHMCLEKARCLLEPLLEKGKIKQQNLMKKIVHLLK